ncbi:MAG: hypothetical protein OEP48_15305 [Betaproteobacteria bacterium]|nr:hypothetical protein [Betaproteobacteria bacterium]MDH3412961.1 hypothetical protein [Gammaproteobacteria bacterium]
MESIRLASLAVEPVEVGVGCAFEGAISFNRRYVMKDGLVRTHPHRASTELSHVEGPIDPEVGVIGLRCKGGEMAGCFVNFACHPNVVRGNSISAGYPGALSRALRRMEGTQFVTIFGNGAIGNLCQIDVHDATKNCSGRDWADHMGDTLAEKVTQTWDRMTFAARRALRGARP